MDSVTGIYSIDKQPFYSSGLKIYMEEKTKDLRIAGFSCDLQAAIEEIKELGNKVSVILLDISIGGTRPLDALDRLVRERIPGVKIVVLTEKSPVLFEKIAITMGAHAYLFKESDPEALIDSIRKGIDDDQPVFKTKLLGFTLLQTQIAEYLAEGKNSGEIARLMGMSLRSVNAGKQRIFEKLKINSAVELARLLG